MNILFYLLISFLVLKYYFKFEIVDKIFKYFKLVIVGILIYLFIKYYNNKELKSSILNSITKIDKVPVERGIVEFENYWNTFNNLKNNIINNNTNNQEDININNNNINSNIDNNMSSNLINNSIKNNKNHNIISTKYKRNVTNGQKKYVGARQQWKCGHCRQILDASYEVDHIKALYKGGTNDLDNLVALCRNCHGKKTIEERLNLI